MEKFLKRLSSRKFLTVLLVQVAVVASMIFRPEAKVAWIEGATQIAELVVLAIAALGYGKIEADVDRDPKARRD